MIDVTIETTRITGSFICRSATDDSLIDNITPGKLRLDIRLVNSTWELPAPDHASVYHGSLVAEIGKGSGEWASLVNGKLTVLLLDILEYMKAGTVTHPNCGGVHIHYVRRLLVYLTQGEIDSLLFTSTEYVASGALELGRELAACADAPLEARQFLAGFDDDGFRIRQLRGQFAVKSHDN